MCRPHLVLLGIQTKAGGPIRMGSTATAPPILPRMGLPAVRISNGEIMFAARTARCYFASFRVSIGLGRLAVFVWTHKRESARSHPSGIFFLTTVRAGARLPFAGANGTRGRKKSDAQLHAQRRRSNGNKQNCISPLQRDVNHRHTRRHPLGIRARWRDVADAM